MWFNKLSCNISAIPGSSASYLQFHSLSLRHLQLCWVSVTHFVHVNSELQNMVNESVPQTNYNKLWSWTLWTCAKSENCFSPTFKVYSLRLQVQLTIFCWVDKMSRIHVVSFCNLMGTTRARRWKSTTFPVDVTRLSPPPIFEERA